MISLLILIPIFTSSDGLSYWEVVPEEREFKAAQIIWNDNGQRYAEAVRSFKIDEARAMQIARDEYSRREAAGMYVELPDSRPLALLGRHYLIGKPYKTKAVLRGFLVNGDTGAVRWYDGGELRRVSVFRGLWGRLD